ncbi:Antilisterial bacteriocin subtilosin biosynthesis protein AlbA [Enhygromyxa salina]|uniref:Antilisterial bacteriocin subtilosin biosynthesis protein AlbA n=1 Tax=Enhygromyxa salina TaxID=215803 RepID=A0A2S9XCS1_9BACT|nr:radical SAM protein [Enhygromyxa salina]PRP90645.1 Antilisterial bacteriocin subtilosin biosynthesis protein AlbA [Enhygromyxa salina]
MAARLPTWLVEALPEEQRGALVIQTSRPRALALRFAGGIVIELGLTQDRPRAYVVRGPLSFAYRVDEGVDGAAASELCGEVAAALASACSTDLVAYLEARPSSARGSSERSSPRATMMLTEGEILRGRKLEHLARATEVEAVELYLHGAACVQSCQFCAYPRVRARQATLPARLGAGLRVLGHRVTKASDVLDWLARVVAIMRARPSGRVTLSGPDCLRHPRIDEMLELLAGERELGVELLGPLTRLSEPELAARVAAVPGLQSICTSLLSTRAEIHDAMVGTPGAHAQVLKALANCRDHGIAFKVNVLVTPANIEELPALLERCAELGADVVNLSLYHPESAADALVHASWRELELPALVVGREALLRAWEATPPRALAGVHAHYLPRCWVPAALREQLLRTPRDLQDNFRHPPGCARCRERERCPGLTVPAFEHLGPDAVEPIGSDPRCDS